MIKVCSITPPSAGGSAPVNVVPPVVTSNGTAWPGPVTGDTVTTTDGTWSDPAGVISYAWYLDSSANLPISTASSYLLDGTEIGHTLISLVTCTNGFGFGDYANTSNPL